jgi:two-component system sensor histidine kinase/response regulator
MKGPTPRTIASALVALLLCCAGALAAGADARPQPQVLVLVSYQYGLPVPQNFVRGVIAALKTRGIDSKNVYVEYLDLTRHRDPEYRRQMAALLHTKLAGHPIELVVGLGKPVLDFLQDEARALFPQVPLLLNVGTPTIDWRAAPRPLAIYTSPMNFAGTVRQALSLLPGTRRVLVVLGRDAESITGRVHEQLAQFAARLVIETTSELSYADMMRRVAQLPPDTIILNPSYFGDKFGHDAIPAEVSAQIAARANAPAFVMYDTLVGNGVVGGFVLKSEAIGAGIGAMAGDILAHRRVLPATPTMVSVDNVPMYDWKQLKRWRLDADRLPPGAVLINQPQTIWTQYQNYVIGAAVIFATLLCSLLLLLRQNSLRRAAESAARDSEARFRVLVEHAPEAILLIDFERHALIEANGQARHLSAPTRDALLEPLGRFDAPAAPTPAMTERVEQMLAGTELRFEKSLLVDGVSRHWEVRIVRLPDTRRRLLRASLSDITERRAAEQALSTLNTELEARVAARTADLQQALETLRLTQKELVQAEKLSALGAMVAGIAHELNTPIGNSILAASTQIHNQFEFERAMGDGLTRSALQRFVHDCGTTLAIIERNLMRAAELVTGFKQVAIDRGTSQRRRFALAELCTETVLTISPSLHARPYRIELALSDDIVLDSYPGPLGQVLTNLINNAIVHGFQQRGHGRIEIAARQVGDRVRLRVSDDGAGIAPEFHSRVFDPFFTTRMGQGGSGLGLHIVHNLVVGVLGGQIALADTAGPGTCFEIDLPCRAPHDVAASAASSELALR